MDGDEQTDFRWVLLLFLFNQEKTPLFGRFSRCLCLISKSYLIFGDPWREEMALHSRTQLDLYCVLNKPGAHTVLSTGCSE